MGLPKLSTQLRENIRSRRLAIFSQCKTFEDRKFYPELSKLATLAFFDNLSFIFALWQII